MIDERGNIENQILRELCLEIGRGARRAGDSLPAVEQVAHELLVHPRHVRAAYQRLEADGLVAASPSDTEVAFVVTATAAAQARALLLSEFATDLAARLRLLRTAGCDPAAIATCLSTGSDEGHIGRIDGFSATPHEAILGENNGRIV